MQEELDDTVKEHIVNLRIDGLTDLSTKLQENYEKYVKDMAINVNHAVDLVSNSADNLSKVLDNVNSSFNAYLKSFHPDAFYGEFVLGVPKMIEEDTKIMTEWVKGVNLPDNEIGKTLKDYEDNLSEKESKYWDAMTSEAVKISDQIGDLNKAFRDFVNNGDFSGGKLGEEYISGGLASGTKSAKPGLYQINEKGPEAIITRRGVMLMPLRAGDGVIPADLTENLMAMAKSGMVPVQTPNFQAPEYNVSQNTNQNVTIHYDSLIRVDGNMDQTVVPQIEEIAKGLISNASFKKNIYNYTTREMGKDMRKAGH